MNFASRPLLIRRLRDRLRELNREATDRSLKPFSATGVAALDGLLPADAFRPGRIAEWIVDRAGCGAMQLALAAAIESMRGGGSLVVIDDRREFYAPAAFHLGLDLERTIVVRPPCRSDVLWIVEQALRCRGVAATWAWIDHLPGRAFRRLQLAAERGGGLGLLMRPAAARRTPTWADQRWLVQPLPGKGASRRVRIELLHCRGGISAGTVELEIDDETGDVRVAPPVAAATDLFRAAGA